MKKLLTLIIFPLLVFSGCNGSKKNGETPKDSVNSNSKNSGKNFQKPKQPELLIVSFPSLKSIKALWSRDKFAFPPYAEIHIEYGPKDKREVQILGLDIKNLEKGELHRTVKDPLLAYMDQDQCRKGVAHISFWDMDRKVVNPTYILYGYHKIRPVDETGIGEPKFKLNLENPPGYKGPVIQQLGLEIFKAMIKNPYQIKDPEIIFPSIEDDYQLSVGDSIYLPINLSPSMRLVLGEKNITNPQADVSVEPADSPYVTMIRDARNNLTLIGKKQGTFQLALKKPGKRLTNVTIKVLPPKAKQASQTSGGSFFVRGGTGNDSIPRATLTRGDLVYEFFSSEKPGLKHGIPPEMTDMVQDIVNTGEIVVAVTTNSMLAFDPSQKNATLWSIPLSTPTDRLAIAPGRLAVLSKPHELISIYAVNGKSKPTLLQVINIQKNASIIRWSGNNLWVFYFDHRIDVISGEGKNHKLQNVIQKGSHDVILSVQPIAGGGILAGTEKGLHLYGIQNGKGILEKAWTFGCSVAAITPVSDIPWIAGGEEGYMLGCSGIKKIRNTPVGALYAMKDGGELRFARIVAGELKTRKIPAPAMRGLVWLVLPWAGGLLVSSYDDLSLTLPVDVFVLNSSGKVLDKVTIEAPRIQFGFQPVPSATGVFLLGSKKGILALDPTE